MNKQKPTNPWNQNRNQPKKPKTKLENSPTPAQQKSADLKFKEAQKKLQAAVQKHVKEYESSSDEEELESKNVIGK